jgi:hypothetical protein
MDDGAREDGLPNAFDSSVLTYCVRVLLTTCHDIIVCKPERWQNTKTVSKVRRSHRWAPPVSTVGVQTFTFASAQLINHRLRPCVIDGRRVERGRTKK